MTASVSDLQQLIESQGVPFLTWEEWWPGGRPYTRWRWSSGARTQPVPQSFPATRHWVHHSVTSVLQSPIAAARTINDIGISRFGRMSYPFLIHSSGAIIQGVFPYLGAHTANYNSTSLAGCNIGNFEEIVPSSAMVQSNGVLVRSLRKLGLLINVPGIDLHYNARGASTQCPGKHLAARRWEIARLGMTDIPREDEDDMTPEERKMLAEIHDSIVKRKEGTAGQLIHDYAKAARLDAKAVREHLESGDGG